jgi:hypothetical protein
MRTLTREAPPGVSMVHVVYTLATQVHTYFWFRSGRVLKRPAFLAGQLSFSQLVTTALTGGVVVQVVSHVSHSTPECWAEHTAVCCASCV